MKMPTVMRGQGKFAQVPKAEIQRSQFDRSHGVKTTFDAGLLVPIYIDEALPGDTFNMKMDAFARLATPLTPIMDNLYLETFFFAMPYRLLVRGATVPRGNETAVPFWANGKQDVK